MTQSKLTDNKWDVAVVGGGASGMTAAITAAESGEKVVLLEGQPRVGRKLLATGNGRCNISNTQAAADKYRSDAPEIVGAIMKKTSPQEVMAFLGRCGIFCMTEREGRMYPRSEQAAAVLDMLRLRMGHLGVQVLCDERVGDIRKRGDVFHIAHTNGTVIANNVIIACGSQAAPQLGGCSDGYTLLESMGHKINRPKAALAPVLSDKELLRSLKGLRAHCSVSLVRDGEVYHRESGEVQFNEDSLSGIAVFQLSARLARYGCKGAELSLDLMPELEQSELEKVLTERRDELSYLSLEDYLTGLLNKRIGVYIMGATGCKPLSREASSLTAQEIKKIAAMIKQWRFPVRGIAGWKQAQLASGGASLRQFDKGLQSTVVKGLFACGEVLDCDSDCGGFNLHWAWCSGITAGRLGAK